jgi:tetratricopeptide (TPR) repeat protein
VPADAPGNPALAEVDAALALQPDWERAALLKAEILARGKTDTAAAIEYLQSFVAANPEARAAAGALAQFYVEQKRFAEARAVFQKLWDRDRNAREFEFGVAVISTQMKDWETAEALFLDLKKANYGENGAVELYLAQVAEETGRYQDAIDRYKAVPEGERAWLAKLRVAAMLAKQGKMVEARRWLADLPAVTIEQRVQVRQAEAQLLRDANDNAGAHEVLLLALKEHPDSTELMYDTAMVAEKLDRIDEAEARLRRIVELKPDDAQALNALGYTLVDRTPRAAEGFVLIEKAHKLSPDDPFILDSMGWALFRLGRYAEAETYLRRAMKERPDAEIAAHLGEVLWAKGERERAQEVWQTQLKTTPDHPLLLETVRRLAR